MKSAYVGVLSITELKDARWNIEIRKSMYLTLQHKILLILRKLHGRSTYTIALPLPTRGPPISPLPPPVPQGPPGA